MSTEPTDTKPCPGCGEAVSDYCKDVDDLVLLHVQGRIWSYCLGKPTEEHEGAPGGLMLKRKPSEPDFSQAGIDKRLQKKQPEALSEEELEDTLKGIILNGHLPLIRAQRIATTIRALQEQLKAADTEAIKIAKERGEALQRGNKVKARSKKVEAWGAEMEGKALSWEGKARDAWGERDEAQAKLAAVVEAAKKPLSELLGYAKHPNPEGKWVCRFCAIVNSRDENHHNLSCVLSTLPDVIKGKVLVDEGENARLRELVQDAFGIMDSRGYAKEWVAKAKTALEVK